MPRRGKQFDSRDGALPLAGAKRPRSVLSNAAFTSGGTRTNSRRSHLH